MKKIAHLLTKIKDKNYKLHRKIAPASSFPSIPKTPKNYPNVSHPKRAGRHHKPLLNFHAQQPDKYGSISLAFPRNYARNSKKIFHAFSQKKVEHLMIVSQNQNNLHLFTSLEYFKLKEILAQQLFIFTYFMEFVQTKGIVLGRDDVIYYMISQQEAKQLIETLFMYNLMGDQHEEYVQSFNQYSL